MFRFLPGALIVATVVLAGIWFIHDVSQPSPQPTPETPPDTGSAMQSPVPIAPDVPQRSTEVSDLPTLPTNDSQTGSDVPMRWIIAGGGALPELNQVSLEQDVQLALSRLPGAGRVFFAAGTGSNTVQVQTQPQVPDELEYALGEIFQPRGGRDSTYRAVSIPNAETATKDATLAAIKQAMGHGQNPLLINILGHGDQGEIPQDNMAGFWPGDVLTAAELSKELDSIQTPRLVRFVVTTCFSGGFAEMVFRDADPESGATPQNRCGLFSATWDLEASGCDPNPDRRAQEGFGQHFWNALAGVDRLGQPIPTDQIDADNNGEISLLEAHGWVRVHSASVEVPTTTSERWLRQVAPEDGPQENVHLPVEDRVIAQLSARLRVTTLEDAQKQLEILQQQSEAALDKVSLAQENEEKAFRMLAGELLARWPVLDDPYHPSYRSMLTRERDAILALLERHESARSFQNKLNEAERAQMALEDSRVRSAPLHRLTRALENRQLARRLKAMGGEDWNIYQRLLACENTAP